MSAPDMEICPKGFQYAEMNLIHSGNEEETLNLVKRAIRMGYDTVVINRDMGDPYPSAEVTDDSVAATAGPPKKKKKTEAVIAQEVPEPFLVDEKKLNLEILEKSGRRFRQYSRLTASLNEPTCIHNFFNNPQLKKYDLIAVRPGDVAILTTLTRKTDFIDIITYPQTEKISWLFMSKKVEAIRNEGVGFEIAYTEALKDSYSRRQFLSNARMLLRSTRGRGVIFSSGARDVIDIRAPVDAMNMMFLFGVDSHKAKPYISGYPRQVLQRAEAKRTVKGTVAITDPENVPSKAMSSSAALQKLLSVPEFRVQIERIPNKFIKNEV